MKVDWTALGGSLARQIEISADEAALLEVVQQPLFLLSFDRRILWRNPPSLGLDIVDATGSAAGRLVLRDREDDRRFTELCQQVAHTAEQGEITLQGADREYVLVARRRSMVALLEHALLERRDRLLVMLRPAAGTGAAAATEQFSFSPVEKRLVAQIAAGRSVREASVELKISYHTARKYLQNIFDKTGARRQAELVAMLSQDRAVFDR